MWVVIVAVIVILVIGLRNYILKIYAEYDDFSDAPFPLEKRGKK